MTAKTSVDDLDAREAQLAQELAAARQLRENRDAAVAEAKANAEHKVIADVVASIDAHRIARASAEEHVATLSRGDVLDLAALFDAFISLKDIDAECGVLAGFAERGFTPEYTRDGAAKLRWAPITEKFADLGWAVFLEQVVTTRHATTQAAKLAELDAELAQRVSAAADTAAGTA